MKLASSSNAPNGPPNTTLLSVISDIRALGAIKLVPSNVKLASSSTSPFAPAISILLSVKSVTLIEPTATLPNDPVNVDDVSVASGIHTNSYGTVLLSSIPINAAFVVEPL